MKKRVGTITFNPAIDESVSIRDFTVDLVNRVETCERHPGGKGVNVARFLSGFADQVGVTGFLGKSNDSIFTEYFRNHQINDQFIRISGETRTGLKILDPEKQTVTEVNYPGIKPDARDIEGLIEKMDEMVRGSDLLVVSGSLPSGVDSHLYKRVIEKINKAGKMTFLDTSGEAFEAALQAVPFMIKPNIHELREYFKEELSDEKQILAKCSRFFDMGISLVVVSMGKEGALFLNKERGYKAKPPETEVVSTVGAGDAMVAGTAWGTLCNFTLEETARVATAFSQHAVTHLEMGIMDRDYFDRIQKEVEITSLYQ